jgi:DNA-binding XRE family transcriptional regulator
VARQTIVAIEAGDYAPSVYLALAICDRLGVTVEALFGSSGTASTPANQDGTAWGDQRQVAVWGVPVKNPPGNQQLDPGARTRNNLLRGLRSQGERGFALLSQRWTALQRITASPRRTTQIIRAALILTQFEHKYIS